MSIKDDLARSEQDNQRKSELIDQLKDEIINLKEELNHYRTAVSAVKWLWDQAAKQREFQL